MALDCFFLKIGFERSGELIQVKDIFRRFPVRRYRRGMYLSLDNSAPIVKHAFVCPLLLFPNTPGNLDNTFPNPSLRRRSGTKTAKDGFVEREEQEGAVESDEYLPAYMLSDWSLERAGRGKRTIDTLACELR